jgi:hypothetical protein
VAVGSGEIIDSDSKPNPPSTAQRNQHDIVLYKREYPRLDIGGGIHAFLAESVVATIEVKSTLDRDELQRSVRAARASKQLKQSVTGFTFGPPSGPQPTGILNYVVAYDGPATMNTVHRWIGPIHAELGIPVAALPQGEERWSQPAPSIDGVFILGKGFLAYDNVAMGFTTDEVRRQHPDRSWEVVDSKSGSLLYLFLLLTAAVGVASISWLNPLPYLSNFQVRDVQFLP